MKIFYFLMLSSLFSVAVAAQPSIVISHFNWNDIPAGPLKAFIGPDAVSATGNTTVKARTAEGSGGLVAPTNGDDTNLLLADSDIYDVDGIDITYDFQRNENVGSIITRGDFLLGDATNYQVRFRVLRPDNTLQTVSSGSVFQSPRNNNDPDDFLSYRFLYTPSTGVAKLFADGTERWTQTLPAGSTLDWDANSAFLIGPLIDGSKYGEPVFDNLIFREVEPRAGLPMKLTSFEAVLTSSNTVALAWETATETDNDRFEVERSTDRVSWDVFAVLTGAGDSDQSLLYTATDNDPPTGLVYYRLKQIDHDGQFSHSDTKSIQLNNAESAGLAVYPNPVSDDFYLSSKAPVGAARIFNLNGTDVTATVSISAESELNYRIDVSRLPAGMYLLSAAQEYVRFLKQ